MALVSTRSLGELLLCPILVFASSHSTAADVVAERGFNHTTQDQRLVEVALDKVNRLIASSGTKLFGSWRVTGAETSSDVPVYLVARSNKGLETPAMVPRGCRCVFVLPAVMKDWIESNSRGSGRMQLDQEKLLIFVLLHEVGHIKKATAGMLVEDGQMSQLNVEPARAKADEEQADDFAINVLRRFTLEEKPSAASIDASWVVTELTKLSWNMQAFRSIDEFGAFAIGKPSVYFDSGYSHPNLAWRILRANSRIQDTQAARELLEAFEDARRRGKEPAPLYERAKPR